MLEEDVDILRASWMVVTERRGLIDTENRCVKRMNHVRRKGQKAARMGSISQPEDAEAKFLPMSAIATQKKQSQLGRLHSSSAVCHTSPLPC